MKANTPTTPSTGRDSGRMISRKLANTPAPSMAAASSISSGMVRKNWRTRNMKNGTPPKKNGTISGR